ncbi:MAG: EAL domain-containing protein, partial [Rhodospirillales bacterium]|nr:EAL domain-containing protein [Rhodospirillales bacterium]
AAQAGLPAGEGQALRAGIDEALERLPVGARASELATGRYGVLAAGEGELGALVERLEGLLRASPAGRRMRVSQTQVKVEAGGMRPGQAARALRYALARFAEAGADGAAASGMAGGLAGIVAEGQRRALEMRTSIAEHRFRLRFQPVVQLDDRRPHHYEALLRPDTGIEGLALGTQDYVLFAEAVGLSEELDLAVLDEALAALAGSPEVRVAVNVSGLSMQSAGFRGRLLARLDAAGPVARRLLVELTETAEVEDMEGAADSIARLRAAGVPVCIDDFGAGAAAFRYLRAFGVDFVKIDGSYVRAATGSARERGFIASMVDLAGAVGARIIAEMIETEEQAMLMSRMGVPFGQGWLFGRPGRLPGALR